ncbi:MAG: hypothetical protein OXN27_11870 [Candidatus Poribacteria bacterium]|nr:hypothetical protein [Candidatus Poribacteria bacterium]
MFKTKGFSKTQRLIFILSLAVVASLCIVSLLPISQADEDEDDTCMTCELDADAQHYDIWYGVYLCSGNSQHYQHQWKSPILWMGNSEEKCRGYVLGYAYQNCGSN